MPPKYFLKKKGKKKFEIHDSVDLAWITQYIILLLLLLLFLMVILSVKSGERERRTRGTVMIASEDSYSVLDFEWAVRED